MSKNRTILQPVKYRKSYHTYYLSKDKKMPFYFRAVHQLLFYKFALILSQELSHFQPSFRKLWLQRQTICLYSLQFLVQPQYYYPNFPELSENKSCRQIPDNINPCQNGYIRAGVILQKQTKPLFPLLPELRLFHHL